MANPGKEELLRWIQARPYRGRSPRSCSANSTLTWRGSSGNISRKRSPFHADSGRWCGGGTSFTFLSIRNSGAGCRGNFDRHPVARPLIGLGSRYDSLLGGLCALFNIRAKSILNRSPNLHPHKVRAVGPVDCKKCITVQVRSARHISSALEGKSESACLGHTFMPLPPYRTQSYRLVLLQRRCISFQVNSPEYGSYERTSFSRSRVIIRGLCLWKLAGSTENLHHVLRASRARARCSSLSGGHNWWGFHLHGRVHAKASPCDPGG